MKAVDVEELEIETEPLLRIYAEMVQAAADKQRAARTRLSVVEEVDDGG